MEDEGFPLNLFDEQPDELFTCQICFGVMKNPVQCPNGHSFCSHCIDSCLKVRPQCPLKCSATLRRENLVVNRIADGMIRKLRVRCPNALETITANEETIISKVSSNDSESFEDGSYCTWRGTVGELTAHFSTCEYKTVSCQFCSLGCPVKLPRQIILIHEQDVTAHVPLMMSTINSQNQIIKANSEAIKANTTLINSMQLRINSQQLLIDTINRTHKVDIIWQISKSDGEKLIANTIKSPTYKIANYDIFVFMRKNTSTEGSDHYELFLNVKGDYPFPTKLNCKFMMFARSNGSAMQKSFDHVFTENIEGWGFKKFVPIADVNNTYKQADGTIKLITSVTLDKVDV